MIMEKGKDWLMAYLAGLKKNQLFLDVFTVFISGAHKGKEKL